MKPESRAEKYIQDSPEKCFSRTCLDCPPEHVFISQPILLRIFLIGIGGFFGSVLRYLLGGLLQRMIAQQLFPLGTFAVNVTGCFAIGFLYFLAETHGVLTGPVRALLITEFLGGFTTFSAFANESFNLMRSGETLLAGINIVGQIAFCLIAVWAGRYLAHMIWR